MAPKTRPANVHRLDSIRTPFPDNLSLLAVFLSLPGYSGLPSEEFFYSIRLHILPGPPVSEDHYRV